MATYISRHLTRRQTIVSGEIKDVNAYGRFYDIAYDALVAGTWPRWVLPAGHLLVRYAAAARGVDAARTIVPNIPGQLVGGSLRLDVRFSGRRLDGGPGQGALYVATPAGLLRESAHYALKPAQAKIVPAGGGQPGRLIAPGAPDATRGFMNAQKAGAAPATGNAFFVFRTARPLQLADLRLGALATFFLKLLAGGEGAKRYGIVAAAPFDFLSAAVAAPDDYSAARGMADAVFDLRGRSGLEGVCALSARSDRDSGLVEGWHGETTEGFVCALFGSDGQMISALQPHVPKGSASAMFDTYRTLADALGLP